MSGKGIAGQAVRRRAAVAVEEALQSRAPISDLLETARGGLAPRDRGLLDELVLGTLRWLRRLDGVLESAAGRPLAEIDVELHGPLRVATHQLLFLDRVPPYAAVDAAVEEIKRRSHKGAAGFANAILRKIAAKANLASWPVPTEDPVEAIAIETSYPTFLVRRWVHRFGEGRARAALEAGNRRPAFQLLCFGDREALAAGLRDESVETELAPLATQGLAVLSGDPRETAAFRSGKLYIQDQASQAAALVPPPAPGDCVLDVAAAPGGKSFSLLAAEPGLRLTAADASLSRLLRLRANQNRLATGFGLAVARAETPPFRAGFDRVIVDLPCSGTGTFARHPELKWRLSESELARLSSQAFEILLAAAELVAPDGRLCAVTCSVESEDNESVVERLLERRTDFRPERLVLPTQLSPFVEGPGRWRVLPADDRDGFTVHVLRRR